MKGAAPTTRSHSVGPQSVIHSTTLRAPAASCHSLSGPWSRESLPFMSSPKNGAGLDPSPQQQPFFSRIRFRGLTTFPVSWLSIHPPPSLTQGPLGNSTTHCGNHISGFLPWTPGVTLGGGSLLALSSSHTHKWMRQKRKPTCFLELEVLHLPKKAGATSIFGKQEWKEQ